MLDAASKGLTCVYDTSSRGDFNIVQELKRKGNSRSASVGDISGQAGIDAESAIGMTYRGMGDEWVKLVGVKYVMDGAISARTAYLTEDYLNQPGFKGVLATSREEAKNIIEGAWKAGLKTSVHANGDATLNMYLDIVEELRKTYPRVDTRDVIVHCTVVNPAIIAGSRRSICIRRSSAPTSTTTATRSCRRSARSASSTCSQPALSLMPASGSRRTRTTAPLRTSR